MARSITTDLLAVDDAEMLSDILGEYVTPHLVRGVDEVPPEMPKRRGVVPVLVGLQETLGEYDHLYDGCVLPFQWRRGKSADSPHLPDGSSDIADSVRQQVRPALERDDVDPDDWTLHLAPPIDDLDLSALKLEGQSMWAPLAAGLILAIRGGTPEPHVFATGAWQRSNDGLESVGHLEAKVEAARRACRRLDEDPVMCVPEDNADTVRDHLGDDGEVVEYPHADTDLQSVFQDHLARLDAPPSKSAPLEERSAYANRSHLSDERRLQYYRNYLLDEISTNFRARLADKLGDEPDVGRLVLTLGDRVSLPLMLLHAFQPERIALIGTEDSFENLETIRETLDELDIRFEPGFDADQFHIDPDSFEEMWQELVEWLREEPDAERRFVELTSGLKPMSAAATLAADRAEARLHYVGHRFDDGPRFGNEQPQFLK